MNNFLRSSACASLNDDAKWAVLVFLLHGLPHFLFFCSDTTNNIPVVFDVDLILALLRLVAEVRSEISVPDTELSSTMVLLSQRLIAVVYL